MGVWTPQTPSGYATDCKYQLIVILFKTPVIVIENTITLTVSYIFKVSTRLIVFGAEVAGLICTFKVDYDNKHTFRLRLCY